MSDAAPRALVVEDDRAWQQILTELLGDVGLAVDVAEDYETAVAHLRAAAHRVAVVDLSLSADDVHSQDGLRVLDAVRGHDPGCVSVLLTGFATVEIAVSALHEHGAYTCLRKETFRRAQFRDLLHGALAAAPHPLAAASFAAHAPQAATAAPAMALSRAEASPAAPAHGDALVVEDDAGWRAVLAELLTGAGYGVRTCSSYAEALGLLRRARYAVAVVDLLLASSAEPAGNRDGERVLEKAQAAGIPAIVVSGQGAPAVIEHAYAEYNLFAYLEKQAFDRAAFLATVAEAVARPGEEDALTGLTRREREVLALLAQGLTNKGIANALIISTNTVKRYLKSIFKKLDVDSRAAATAKAVRAGLVPASPRT